MDSEYHYFSRHSQLTNEKHYFLVDQNSFQKSIAHKRDNEH